MRLSEQRISHLSSLVRDGLQKEGLATFRDQSLVLNTLKETFARIDAVDTLVRQKLERQHKVAGTREWQLMYDRYFHEEMAPK
ncbi:MAG: DUF507 family protein, partial [Desulfuromonadales bacterium]|nr:DUF507 family protein [Desulfuromonadales bacterium]